MSVQACLGLGSNLGDREATLRQAVARLADTPGLRIADVSCLYETEPVAMADAAGWFLNLAVLVETTLSPSELLQAILTIEQWLGRIRPSETAAQTGYQSRTLDIDLLFYGETVMNEPGLRIPHPHLHERAFVLVPMLEVAPDWHHPVLKRTVADLHFDLPAPEAVAVYAAWEAPHRNPSDPSLSIP